MLSLLIQLLLTCFALGVYCGLHRLISSRRWRSESARLAKIFTNRCTSSRIMQICSHSLSAGQPQIDPKDLELISLSPPDLAYKEAIKLLGSHGVNDPEALLERHGVLPILAPRN